MVKDFKNRVRPTRKKYNKRLSVGRFFLVVLLLLGFGYFLNSLRQSSESVSRQLSSATPKQAQQEMAVSEAKQSKPMKPSTPLKKKQVQAPRYDFFTLLPEKEVVVPDYEIKTRNREEKAGKRRAVRYMMQAGSFRNNKDADRLKAKLALIGIESKIELARIGDVNWYRVKLGPFLNMSATEVVRQRLRKNFIDVVVTEK
ncbi:MAG: SPOR domain-containing protein [Methylococcales bacterium]|nr:SPOR domain-containing protein [Methylococcales bacterium]